ncbi:hypothetical protein EBT16_09380 [bacterium]|nr:hypothetical protein [bacterium]
MPHKVGAYIRVSTEEQAQVVEGSIDSQKFRLKKFVEGKNDIEKTWGKLIDLYIDDGFSAKDTKRPAYQKMMRDVRAGKINLILVSDVSRLSRNIHDFCSLLKDLEDHKAKFLSVKEQFDTSTPAGEMMIYNMINLAQFERRQTAERVSMNFHSRALRGLLSGGNPILGFDKDPENRGRLIVNQSEAVMVRKIFDTYLETGSLQDTAKALNGSGIQPKIGEGRRCRHVSEGRWTVGSVRNHLLNLAYVGKLEVNRRFKNEDSDTLKSWQKYQIVDASWPAIVDEKVFYSVQKLVDENREKERFRFKTGQRRFFLLSGIIRCGECGRALIGQTSTGRSAAHRYYGHKIIVGETNSCRIKRFRSEDVEAAVVNHLDEMLLRAGYLDQIEKNIRQMMAGKTSDALAERERIKKDLLALDKEIESAFKLHSEMNSSPSVLDLVREKLESLADKKRELVKYLESTEDLIQKDQDAREARKVIEDQALEQTWPFILKDRLETECDEFLRVQQFHANVAHPAYKVIPVDQIFGVRFTNTDKSDVNRLSKTGFVSR